MNTFGNYKLLSHLLDGKTLGYGASPALSISWDKRLDKGGSCNLSFLRISSHAGTHLDAARHFLTSGKAVSDYKIKDIIFRHPCVVSCPKQKNELVLPQDIASFHSALKKSDILLLRTGFGKLRNRDVYYRMNPGISPALAQYIRKNYPQIRCVGIDSISISPFQKRDLGRLSHRIFLQGKSPVLLLEDMNLNYSIEILRKIKMIMVLPLFVKDLEAAPCTVLGYL